jgi:hypothetical protein
MKQGILLWHNALNRGAVEFKNLNVLGSNSTTPWLGNRN